VSLLAVVALVCLALACKRSPPSESEGEPPPPSSTVAPAHPTSEELPPPPPPPQETAGEILSTGEGSDATEIPATTDESPTGEEGQRLASAPLLVDKTLRSVRVFYGTNRARTEPCAWVEETHWDASTACRPDAYYGGLPADTEEAAGGRGAGTEGLEVGTLAVTFPPHHAAGKIERPLKVFSFSLRDEDPDKDVVISELRSFADEAAWAAELKATGRDQAFIYVHGFDTTFDQAARRAAQLAYDLDFDLEKDFRGVPMLFSWPSRGGVGAYGADYDASFESIGAFNRFLDLVKHQAGIRRVHVIAHSMGNRVVAEAFYARGQRPERIIDQLVLAAPDVWASRFKNRFLRTLPQLASRVTLYVSDRDRALVASSRIREDEPRAGQVAGGLLEASRGVDRFDAINASTLSTDFLGHSYYASQGSMLGDIYCLLKGAPVTGRPLLAQAGAAWQFRPPQELAGLDPAACAATVATTTAPPRAIPGPAPAGFPWLAVELAVLVAALLILTWRRLRRR
jgi:esterase/lipase superfamily enzyme